MYLPTLRQKVSSRDMAVLQRSKIAVSEQDLFNKKTIAMEALGMCLSYG